MGIAFLCSCIPVIVVARKKCIVVCHEAEEVSSLQEADIHFSNNCIGHPIGWQIALSIAHCIVDEIERKRIRSIGRSRHLSNSEPGTHPLTKSYYASLL